MGNKDYVLYCHVNRANQKRYFGITNDVERRWRNCGYYYMHNGQRAFASAIKKYGWNGFEHLIILTGLTRDEACDAEKKYIRDFKTNICRYGNHYGYNMTDGGDGVSGRLCSDAHRAKTSKALLGNQNGLNHTVTNRARQRISASLLGHTVSEDTRNKISKSLLTNNSNAQRRAVVCLDTDVVYGSIAEAVTKLGIASSSISQCCSKRRKTAGGYHWAYYSEIYKN